jgi:hypothetical protein
MERAGIVIRDLYEDPTRIIAPHLEDTSDGNWSPTIRKSWPYFIMGVCEMWLNLIDELSKNTLAAQKRPSLKNLLASYQKTNETIKNLWQTGGGHSLLHHLNAIFGYEPVLIHEVNLRRFSISESYLACS